MGGPCILILAALIGLIVWFVAVLRESFSHRDNQSRARHVREVMLKWGLWILAVILLLALLFPPLPTAREAARRAHCTNNLKTIWLAMRDYHDRYGCFPPAYTADEHARPLHSWRTLLLPLLEYQDLYDQLRLDEPWDSPHNRAILNDAEPPSVFCCPSAIDDPKCTSYAMVVGAGTISDGPNSRRWEDILDGLDKTVIVVEATRHSILWYEPRDLLFDQMSFKINDAEGQAIRSRHAGVATVLFADGSVQSLSDSLAPELMKGLLTIAGGEDVDQSDLY